MRTICETFEPSYKFNKFTSIGSYIQKLTPMFLLNPDNSDSSVDNWSPQKISNIHCLVQVVRALVAPSGHAQVSTLCYLPNQTLNVRQLLNKKRNRNKKIFKLQLPA